MVCGAEQSKAVVLSSVNKSLFNLLLEVQQGLQKMIPSPIAMSPTLVPRLSLVVVAYHLDTAWLCSSTSRGARVGIGVSDAIEWRR